MGEPEHPEIPYPFPPGREPPRRTEPVAVPMVGMPEGDPLQRLFERRRILLSGPLDREATNHLCAQLMALDGESARDVEVVLNSTGGPIAEVSAVLDVLDLMRAESLADAARADARQAGLNGVHVLCADASTTDSYADAPPADILLACGTGRRRAASHATVSLRCDRPETLDGTAADITRAADELAVLRRRLQDALVAATGQSADSIAAELDHGGVHPPAEARELGIVDEVVAGR
jgi:ATP-dependent Clp protease protease subunit